MAGAQADEAPVAFRRDNHVESAVIVVPHRDKPERLKHAARRGSHRRQHLRHTLNTAGVRLECNFDEVTVRYGFCQLQQAAGDGNNLELALGPISVRKFDDGWSRCELNSGCAVAGIDLGIVGHAKANMAPACVGDEITEAQCTDSELSALGSRLSTAACCWFARKTLGLRGAG